MTPDSILQPGKDRFPWAILVMVFLVQFALGGFFCWNQHREDIAIAEEDLAANLQVLETILQTSLQNAQYQDIDPLLTNWIQLYQDKVDHLDLTADNGFVHFQHDQERPAEHVASRSLPITYSYQGAATLTVRWSLAATDRHARDTLLLLGVIQLFTTLSLVFFLRLATMRKRDARKLADRARELDLANRDLHHEMEQRAAIEENLAEEKEQLQVTLRNLGEGVISVDREGIILLVNSAAADMLGCHEDACRGKSIDDVLALVHEESGSGFGIFASGYLQDPDGNTSELLLHSRDRNPRNVGVGCSPITGGQDEVTGWVVVIRDTTGARHLEQEQRKNSMLQALGVLAGGIAHDFNNILMAISGNLNLALELLEDNAEIDEILSSAEKASDRAADLTRQLLTFAKGGSPILDATAIDEVVREAANFVIHGADIDLKFEFESDLRPVLIDRHQIGQVIQNLVINARQAMSTGGCLVISGANVVERQEGRETPMVRIAIADQGSGIPEANLQHLFDPYYTTKREGSGLGLAVVHSIISRHRGRIEVQSRLGEGTTFTIHLPVSREARGGKGTAGKPLIRNTGRVLVMDDDQEVRVITMRMVRRLGFEVVGAVEGAEALEFYRDHLQRQQAFDVVIVDLTVPRGMGGLETTRDLLEIDPECRVIVTSGYSSGPVMANYRDYGFKAALIKPYNIRRLNRALNEVLGRP